MIKFCIENNLTKDILYQDDGYVLLDEYNSLIKKENQLNDMKQKLKNVSKNIKSFEGLDGLNESFKEILKNDINNNEINIISNNDVGARENDNNEINNENENENNYNEYVTSDDNELIDGEINSDEKNNDYDNYEGNEQ